MPARSICETVFSKLFFTHIEWTTEFWVLTIRVVVHYIIKSFSLKSAMTLSAFNCVMFLHLNLAMQRTLGSRGLPEKVVQHSFVIFNRKLTIKCFRLKSALCMSVLSNQHLL